MRKGIRDLLYDLVIGLALGGAIILIMSALTGCESHYKNASGELVTDTAHVLRWFLGSAYVLMVHGTALLYMYNKVDHTTQAGARDLLAAVLLGWGGLVAIGLARLVRTAWPDRKPSIPRAQVRP